MCTDEPWQTVDGGVPLQALGGYVYTRHIERRNATQRTYNERTGTLVSVQTRQVYVKPITMYDGTKVTLCYAHYNRQLYVQGLSSSAYTYTLLTEATPRCSGIAKDPNAHKPHI